MGNKFLSNRTVLVMYFSKVQSFLYMHAKNERKNTVLQGTVTVELELDFDVIPSVYKRQDSQTNMNNKTYR